MIGECMHPYSISSSEREHVTCALAISAIPVIWALSRFVVYMRIAVPWWCETVSIASVFGLLYCLFDKHIWKCRVLHKLGIISTPNLNGIWTGYLKSSVDECNKEQKATLNISQRWTTISISLQTDRSKSSSLVAAMIIETESCTSIYYEYRNEPLPTAGATMHAHRGSAQLILDCDSRSLEGEYYTGRDRQTHGSMRFELQ
jgi:hypothetical protein